MKAYLDFDFDNEEDRMRFMRMIVADGMAGALWAITEYLIGQDEYNHLNTKDQIEKIEEIKKDILEIISDHGINLGEIH